MNDRVAHNKLNTKYIQQFASSIGVEFLDEYVGSSHHHQWRCLKHNKICKHTYDKIRTSKRLKCCATQNRQQQTLPEAIQFAKQHNMSFNMDEYQGTQHRINWTCNIHKKINMASFHALSRTKGNMLHCCIKQQSNDKLKFEYAETILPLLRTHQYTLVGEYTGMRHKHQFICNKHNKTKTSRPVLLRDGGILRCCAGERNSGANHSNFNPNISNTQRTQSRLSYANVDWSKRVRTRDNYACVICNHNQKCIAHHLNSYMAHPEQRYDTSNGVTLCRSCHTTFHRQYGVKCTTAIQFNKFYHLCALGKMKV